jgi:hypothetical protein
LRRQLAILYTVQDGETLSGIANRFAISVQALVAANGIASPDFIIAGQSLIIPYGCEASSFSASWGNYRLVPGTTHQACLGPVNAPVRGDPRARNRATYNKVIDQFAVEINPRYASYNGETYCNVFVWDVTRAMGAEIPHIVVENGEPEFGCQSMWLGANGMNQWLNECGPRHSWHERSIEEIQSLANLGHPAVATIYCEPVGHIGVVRPGEMLNGPTLAQAGTYNFNYAHIYDCFPVKGTQFFANDAGTVVEAD